MHANRLNSLPHSVISQRLRSKSGLTFDIGPFRIGVTSHVPAISAHIVEMYGEYRLADTDFADLHVSVETPSMLRSFWRKQVNFQFDDEHPFKPLPYAQARPFFEWGLNWCIASTAHQYLIIHAAVVEKNGRCAMLPGIPGAGKSTLCATLVLAGWRLFSDEMALIDLKSGLIWPVPRPISLKNASIDILHQRNPESHFGPIVTDTHKGTVTHLRAPVDSVDLSNSPAPAAWVIFPRYEAGAALTTTAISPCHATLKLADDSFNLPLIGGPGFSVLADVAACCDSYQLHYSNLDEAIRWFSALS